MTQIHEEEQVLNEVGAAVGKPVAIVDHMFTGAPAAAQISEDGHVVALQIVATQLTEIPESIGHLTSLEWLNIGATQLTEIPESIGNLTALKHLDLSRNQLTAIPESIGNLTALRELSLDRNQLTAIPESIGNLTALKVLRVNNNPLQELPRSVGQLLSLEDLRVPNGTEIPELGIGLDVPDLLVVDQFGDGRVSLIHSERGFDALDGLAEISYLRQTRDPEWATVVLQAVEEQMGPGVSKVFRSEGGDLVLWPNAPIPTVIKGRAEGGVPAAIAPRAERLISYAAHMPWERALAPAEQH